MKVRIPFYYDGPQPSARVLCMDDMQWFDLTTGQKVKDRPDAVPLHALLDFPSYWYFEGDLPERQQWAIFAVNGMGDPVGEASFYLDAAVVRGEFILPMVLRT